MGLFPARRNSVRHRAARARESGRKGMASTTIAGERLEERRMLAVPGAPSLWLGAGVPDGATRVEALQASGVVMVAGESGNRISVSFVGTTAGAVDTTKVFFKEVRGRGAAVPVPVTLTGADLSKLGDGLVHVNAVQVNRGGKGSAVASTFFVIDTAPPAIPVVGLGAGISDGATRAEAVKASGVVTVAGEVGSRISLSFVGTTNGVVDTNKIFFKEVRGRGAGDPVPVALRGPEVARLGDGLVYVNCVQVDRAGNSSAVGSAFFSIDTAAPPAPVVGLGAGVRDGANRKESKQASGVITVSGEAGNRISVSFNGTTNGFVDAAKVFFKEVTGRGAGVRVPVTLTGADVTRLGDGPVFVNCVQVDPAGNAGPVASTSYTVDPTPPSAPEIRFGIGVPDGASRIEATQATGVIAVSGEADNRVAVSFVGTSNGAVDVGKVVSKDVFVGDVSGWVPVQLTPDDVRKLGDGVVFVNTVQVDPAGRMSPLRTTSVVLSTGGGAAAGLKLVLTNDVLRIDGTDGDDAVFVRESATGFAVDYASGENIIGHMLFPKGVKKLEVLAGGGQDMVVLRAPSLASGTVVDTGAGADLVVSSAPVDVRSESGVGQAVPVTDRSLPAGLATTTRRTESPNVARETTYVGQALAASRTWTSDGRRVDVSLDGSGNTVRDTFLGDRLALSETWDATTGYQRTVTAADGTRLRETFDKGTLLIEERERDGRSTTTVWDDNGPAIRHTIDDGALVAEEVWDGAGGQQRTRVDDAGRVVKEVFANGTLVLKTITDGGHVDRIGRDAQGNGVYEELVDGVVVRRDQWDTTGNCRITRFVAGRLYSQETLRNGRRVQLEVRTDAQVVKTVWNERDDRIAQTFVGETKVREEEIRSAGGKRVTEWSAGQMVRTLTDAGGNVSVETSAGERLLSREQRSVDGRSVRTTFDATTGQATLEERATADGRQVQRTTFSPAEVLRLSLRDGVVVQRERWQDGGLRRISDDGSGTIRDERFTNSDRATLAEGTKVSDTVTTAAGDEMKTVWDSDGTKRVTGSRNGIVVLEERHRGSSVTKTLYGDDGSRQEEVFEGGLRTKLMQLAGDGSYREQRFTSAGMNYELLRNSQFTFRETTWSRAGAYGADQEIAVVEGDGPGTIGWRNSRMRTVSGPGYQTRQLWRGFGSVPDSGTTYYEQSDYTLNGFGQPLKPTEINQEIYFFDAGRLVFHQATRGNGSSEVLTNRPSAAWEQAKQGSFFGLTGGNVLSLVPGGGSFNLDGPRVGGYLGQVGGRIAAGGKKFVGGVETLFKPLEESIGKAAVIFQGIGAIGNAMDVNFRTLQGDLGKIVGSIDLGKITLPALDNVSFGNVGFGKVFDVDFKMPEVKFTNPFASIDFSPVTEPGLWSFLTVSLLKSNPLTNGSKWFADRFFTALDWLAENDPFAWAGRSLGVDWGPSGERKVLLVMPGERFLEAGYTRDQAAILHDLMDRTPPGLRGRYLDEFNVFLAEEGQKVYQSHLLADGADLDPAGHARLQEQASQAAQTRLLARYGLSPDGSKILPRGSTPGLGLGDIPLPPVTVPDETDPRFNTGAESTYWDFDPEPIQPAPKKKDDGERRNPKKNDDPDEEADRRAEEQAQSEREAREKKQRIEETRRKVREQFPAAIRKAAGEKLALYAQGKGKQVADFHDSVEQTLRVGGAFAAGLGEGAAAAVEGLAKSVVAALDADTWRGVATTVKEQGRNFMKAEDKAKFVADFGEQAYKSLEDSLVKSVDEWQKESPEGRARMLGKVVGQVATDSVLTGVMNKIAGRIPLPSLPGRKTREAVDRVTGSKEFAAFEKRIKDAAGPNKKDPAALLEGYRTASGRALAEQLRKECGMDPEHVRKLAEYARKNNLSIVVRSANPNSLQWHGKPGFSAKPGSLSLKTNPKTGLVTATRRADGTLVDAIGKAVEGRKVDAQGWIVNTDKLVNGKPMRTSYRLDGSGHVVDAKGTKFFGDYDILSVDKSPVAGTDWLGVPTGTKTTGSRTIIDEMNEAIVGKDRARDMFKHGANRENLIKDDAGIFQVETPEIGDTFAVIDPDGSVFVGDRLYVKRLTEGRGISTDFVVPPLPPGQSVEF